ncbi:MAG: hypothetical protein KJ655_01725 [Candidatus Thermoplasmatota archaeon]|nr:hypothetical protein [Candidatus Thermoplasmatota archaeon]
MRKKGSDTVESRQDIVTYLYIVTNIYPIMCGATETIMTMPEEVTKSLDDIKGLLEDILETMNILTDPEMMSQIRGSEADIKEGRVTKFS